jgi:hypothetical protein
MSRFDQPIEPMTLGNMRGLGVRSLDVSCWNCPPPGRAQPPRLGLCVSGGSADPSQHQKGTEDQNAPRCRLQLRRTNP